VFENFESNTEVTIRFEISNISTALGVVDVVNVYESLTCSISTRGRWTCKVVECDGKVDIRRRHHKGV